MRARIIAPIDTPSLFTSIYYDIPFFCTNVVVEYADVYTHNIYLTQFTLVPRDRQTLRVCVCVCVSLLF